MLKIINISAFLSASVLILISCSRTGVKKGEMAPDFTLNSLKGEKVRLSEYRGKELLLNFWSDCCTDDSTILPKTQKIYDRIKQNGSELLTVNIGQWPSTAGKPDDYAVTFPILIDETGTVAKLYNIRILPTLLLISKEGKIMEILTGWRNREYMQKLSFK